MYSTKLTLKVTGATANQLKYWVKIGLVRPENHNKAYFYSLKDIIRLRVLTDLRNKGLSLQKVRAGIKNLSEMLPNEAEPLSRLIIHTDGFDMIVAEKGKYFSAITRQRYFRFDTEKIRAEITSLQRMDSSFSRAGVIAEIDRKVSQLSQKKGDDSSAVRTTS